MLEEVYAAPDSYAAEHGYDLNQIYADLERREVSSDLPSQSSRPFAKGITTGRGPVYPS